MDGHRPRPEAAASCPPPPRYAGVNISNVGGVTVVGNDNIVRTQFAPVAEQLQALREAVNKSEMPDEEKLVVNTEVDRIELELRRDDPDRGVISRSREPSRRQRPSPPWRTSRSDRSCALAVHLADGMRTIATMTTFASASRGRAPQVHREALRVGAEMVLNQSSRICNRSSERVRVEPPRGIPAGRVPPPVRPGCLRGGSLSPRSPSA